MGYCTHTIEMEITRYSFKSLPTTLTGFSEFWTRTTLCRVTVKRLCTIPEKEDVKSTQSTFKDTFSCYTFTCRYPKLKFSNPRDTWFSLNKFVCPQLQSTGPKIRVKTVDDRPTIDRSIRWTRVKGINLLLLGDMDWVF